MTEGNMTLIIIFGFILAVIWLGNRGDQEKRKRKEKEKKQAEPETKAKAEGQMDREELLKAIDDLNKRIENLQTIKEERKSKNGN
ncbi:MAG: hypothetical protein PHI83_01940 [Sphaerochaetaceae bacterium]|jgi:flagellar biosynthesis/type III secretory pathway M-ring protein FliF/YscJ|nr:hypothetical protein [Sphaerochaetaceae bacterium]